MAPVRITMGSLANPAFVGKLIPANGVPGVPQYEVPVQLQLAAASADGIAPVEGAMTSRDASGRVRSGTPLDVKPGCHWLLVPRADGVFELRPTALWYEFGKPTQSSISIPAKAAPKPAAKAQGPRWKTVEDGEAELKKDSRQRMEFASKWERMSAKGSKDRGKVQAVGDHVLVMAQEVYQDEVDEQQGEQQQQQQQQQAPQPKGKAKVAAVKRKRYNDKAPLDEDRLKDDSGLKKQTQKKKKALEKEAQAFWAEDEDAPHSANGMLELKRAKGDNPWDFEDEDLFSDDEQEKVGFEEDLKNAEEEYADVPSGDEEAEKVMSAQGQEIENLLQKSDAPAGASSGDDDDMGPVDGDDDMSLSGSEASPAEEKKLPKAQPAVQPQQTQNRRSQAQPMPQPQTKAPQQPEPQAVSKPQVQPRPEKEHEESKEQPPKKAQTSVSTPKAGPQNGEQETQKAKQTRCNEPKQAAAVSRHPVKPKQASAASRHPVTQRQLDTKQPVIAEQEVPQPKPRQSRQQPSQEIDQQKTQPAADGSDLQERVVEFMRSKGGRCQLVELQRAVGGINSKSPRFASLVKILKVVTIPEPRDGTVSWLRLKPELAS